MLLHPLPFAWTIATSAQARPCEWLRGVSRHLLGVCLGVLPKQATHNILENSMLRCLFGSPLPNYFDELCLFIVDPPMSNVTKT